MPLSLRHKDRRAVSVRPNEFVVSTVANRPLQKLLENDVQLSNYVNQMTLADLADVDVDDNSATHSLMPPGDTTTGGDSTPTILARQNSTQNFRSAAIDNDTISVLMPTISGSSLRVAPGYWKTFVNNLRQIATTRYLSTSVTVSADSVKASIESATGTTISSDGMPLAVYVCMENKQTPSFYTSLSSAEGTTGIFLCSVQMDYVAGAYTFTSITDKRPFLTPVYGDPSRINKFPTPWTEWYTVTKQDLSVISAGGYVTVSTSVGNWFAAGTPSNLSVFVDGILIPGSSPAGWMDSGVDNEITNYIKLYYSRVVEGSIVTIKNNVANSDYNTGDTFDTNHSRIVTGTFSNIAGSTTPVLSPLKENVTLFDVDATSSSASDNLTLVYKNGILVTHSVTGAPTLSAKVTESFATADAVTGNGYITLTASAAVVDSDIITVSRYLRPNTNYAVYSASPFSGSSFYMDSVISPAKAYYCSASGNLSSDVVAWNQTLAATTVDGSATITCMSLAPIALATGNTIPIGAYVANQSWAYNANTNMLWVCTTGGTSAVALNTANIINRGQTLTSVAGFTCVGPPFRVPDNTSARKDSWSNIDSTRMPWRYTKVLAVGDITTPDITLGTPGNYKYYKSGDGNLSVYRNGELLPPAKYTEVSDSVVRLATYITSSTGVQTTCLLVGDVIDFVWTANYVAPSLPGEANTGTNLTNNITGGTAGTSAFIYAGKDDGSTELKFRSLAIGGNMSSRGVTIAQGSGIITFDMPAKVITSGTSLTLSSVHNNCAIFATAAITVTFPSAAAVSGFSCTLIASGGSVTLAVGGSTAATNSLALTSVLAVGTLTNVIQTATSTFFVK
jgi:hypothetical protein